MSPANEQIRDLDRPDTLRQIMAEVIVIEVPQGVAILRTDGRHALIRIDARGAGVVLANEDVTP